MKDITPYLVSPQIPVLEAISLIRLREPKALFIVDCHKILLGLFSEDDLRRYILNNGDLTAPITSAMNPNPVTLPFKERAKFSSIIQATQHTVYPVVNKAGKIMDILSGDDMKNFLKDRSHSTLPADIHTVIMAGGLGTRLYPYTQILPKALIPIVETPICTRIMDHFKKYGCSIFDLILNHKKNMIKAYYSEENEGGRINFYEENNFLGTAGGLSLLKGKIDKTFFVSNCDILVEANYTQIYRFHKKEKNLITVIGALKNSHVAYGVIHLKENGSEIQEIEEKPTFSFLANVGLYVVEPEVLEYLKEDQFMHMTDLIARCIKNQKKVGVFPISGEDWLDMGQIEEMKQMTETLKRKMEK